MRLLALVLALAVAGSGAAGEAGADARRVSTKRCLPFALAVKPKRCPKRAGTRSPMRVSMGALTPSPPAAPTPPAPDPTPPVARLGVTAREWSLVLSRAVLAAGPARVQLQNLGEDAHNLRIERSDGSGGALSVPLAEAGERSEGAGALQAGTYKVYCTLPGHEAAGMRATLRVR